jgi:hypothetical protein
MAPLLAPFRPALAPLLAPNDAMDELVVVTGNVL